MMDISQDGIERIKAFEVLRLTAYQCSADRWTIGYGHTNGVKAEDVITLEQADAFLRDDIDAVVELNNPEFIRE